MIRDTGAIRRHKKALLIGVLIHLSTLGHCVASDNLRFNVFKSGSSGPAKTSDVAVRYTEIDDSINVNGLDFSPDGKYLATSSYAQSDEVHIWDWQSKRIFQKLEQGGSGDPTVSEGLRYSPDGRFLAACHGRGGNKDVVRIWETKTGRVVKDILEPVGGTCRAIGFTPNSEFMLRIAHRLVGHGDNIVVYSTKTWEQAWVLSTEPFYPRSLAISSDGKFAALGGIDLGTHIPDQPKICIVDLHSRRISQTIIAFPLENEIKRLAWSPDGTQIAAGAVVGGSSAGPDIVKIFDPRTGQQVNSEPVSEPAYARALRYSPDGKYLAEGHINHKIRIWDGQHKTLLQEIPIEDYGMNLAFSHDGRFMAIANGGKTVQVWKMK